MHMPMIIYFNRVLLYKTNYKLLRDFYVFLQISNNSFFLKFYDKKILIKRILNLFFQFVIFVFESLTLIGDAVGVFF